MAAASVPVARMVLVTRLTKTIPMFATGQDAVSPVRVPGGVTRPDGG